MTQQYVDQRAKIMDGLRQFDGCFLAGGAVNSAFTGRDIVDFDLYFKSEQTFRQAVEDAFDDGLWCAQASHRSVTFSDGGSTTLQFMHFEFFDSAAAVFDAFDFTICMGAWDTSAKEFVLHPDFLTDCAARRLRFHSGTRFPLISALRVLKYQERGYAIDRANMLQLAMACAALDLQSWEDLEHQIGGLYGDRIQITRDGEFSLERAIRAVAQNPQSVSARMSEPPAYLGSAETLLEHLYGPALRQAAE